MSRPLKSVLSSSLAAAAIALAGVAAPAQAAGQAGTRSQITYGVAPGPLRGDTADRLRQLAQGQPFIAHLYLPWSQYPQALGPLDQTIRSFAARGLRIDLVLRYDPPAGHNGDLEGFASFVRAVVDHYARQRAVTRIGITNESNFPLDCSGADGCFTDPIGALIAGIEAAVKARASDGSQARLGFNWAYRGCDPSGCGPFSDDAYWSELGARGGSELARDVDYVAMDIYPGTIFPPGDPSADPYQPGLDARSEVATAIEDLRFQLMPLAGLAAQIPIGIQEIGWPSAPPVRSDAEQAAMLEQFAAGACDVVGETNFRTFYWFTLNDGNSAAGVSPQSAKAVLHFGLIRSDGQATPAFAAYQQVIRSGCPAPQAPSPPRRRHSHRRHHHHRRVPRHRPPRWSPDPPRWGVQRIYNVPITMPDGTVLRADLGIPTPANGSPRPAGERFPVLLEQTPYYKDGPVNQVNAYFVQRGYAFVLVDVRGTGSSQGQWQVLGTLEQRDGVQIVRWAAGQRWSDGRIALYGGSYGAIAALLTAEQPDLPAAVKAIFAAKPASDLYRDIFFHGGSFDAEGAAPFLALTSAAWGAPAQQTASGSPQDLLTTLEHYPDAQTPVQVISDALTGGETAYDGPFWQERSPLTHIDSVRAPTFIVGGEFDLFQRGQPILFARLRAPKRLLLGPWVHTQEGTGLPADGIPSEPELALQWFDQYLRDENTGVTAQPDVIQYRLEGAKPSHFLTSSGYPLKGLGAVNLYLDNGPSGSARSLNDGRLDQAPAHAFATDPLPYKPADTGCTRSTIQWGGGAINDSPTPNGSGEYPCATDQRENELQALTYTSPPLAKAITIDGPINVHLIAQSPQGRNTTFAVTLTDVAPDGSSIALTNGWLVASLRETAPSPAALTVDGLPLRVYHPFTRSSEQQPPASPTSYDIEVFPTFATFPAGDRIRLDIYTGDVPHLAPSAQQQLGSIGGTFLIDHGPRAQSYITLPEIRQ